MAVNTKLPRKIGLLLSLSFIAIGIVFLGGFVYVMVYAHSDPVLGFRLFIASLFFLIFGLFYLKMTQK